MPMPNEQESTLAEIEAEDAQDELGFPAEEGIAGDDLEVVVVEGEDPPAEGEDPPAEGEDPPAEGEAPPAEGEDALDAELEAADKAYPEPIRKRIKREIRIRKRVEAEFEQVRDAAIQVAKVAQSSQAELAETKETLRRLRAQHAEVLDTTFDKEIHIKQAVLRKARDDGDYDAEMKVQAEINQLQFQQNQVREVRRTMGSDTEKPAAATPAAPRAPAADTPPAAAPRPPAAPGAVKWVNANKAWFRQPKFAGQTQFVLGVDAQLTREGYDKNTADYYAELDRRIDETFPTLRKPPTTTNSPVAAAGNRGGAARPAGGKKSITLTKADLDNMRRYGLDPSNKAHLQEYARNKVTS